MKQGLFIIISLIVLTSAFDTITQLFLKSAINSLNFKVNGIKEVLQLIMHLAITPRVWLGFLFSLASLLTWLIVLSRADLNFAFSMDSMHYIFIAFASWLILKEKVGAKRWLGTILIVAGIILVTLS